MNRDLDALAREIDCRVRHDPRVDVLCQIHGIGRYLGMLIVAEIGEIERFPTARHLCAWAGLTPTVRSSDANARLGHISRLGSKALRWALVEAAQKAVQGGGPLRGDFERIAKRRGRKIAKVAIARKILTLCLYGLRDSEIRFLRPPRRASALKSWRRPHDRRRALNRAPRPEHARASSLLICARAQRQAAGAVGRGRGGWWWCGSCARGRPALCRSSFRGGCGAAT